MTIGNKGSVSRALDDLKVGENVDIAARKLWDHAFNKLIHMARNMLRNTPRARPTKKTSPSASSRRSATELPTVNSPIWIVVTTSGGCSTRSP